MYFTGFADEAGPALDTQIQATLELGWNKIETRGLCGKNLAFISEAEFDELCGKLDKSGVSFNCFGSGVANWSKPISEAPDSSYDEMRLAIPRMKKLGIEMIRMMSFAVPKELREKDFRSEVIKRLKVIVAMAEDAGILCVHENCMNWGGLSYEHTLRLLDGIQSPAFKLVFDTGNPVFSDDVRGKPPYRKQDSLEFYMNVREHVAYIHIKDGRMENDKSVFTYPCEGDGKVREILSDLIARGYDGGISIEPHMAQVFHEQNKDPDKSAQFAYSNYVEYGKRTMALVDAIKKTHNSKCK